MSKIIVHNQNELIALISGLSEKGEYPLTINWSSGVNRSLSQNAFSHVIYSEISRYLVSKGRADCSPDWIKRMLKNRFLGWQDETYTDIVTGEKVVKQVLRHTSKLDKGDMLNYLTEIINWAESIGCEIKIPVNSQYMKFMDEQNE